MPINTKNRPKRYAFFLLFTFLLLRAGDGAARHRARAAQNDNKTENIFRFNR